MKLSQFKEHLDQVSDINFTLPDGSLVPTHFHVTEAGLTTKHFIDCGGTVRLEKKISFQLWTALDFDHRLKPQKLIKIIDKAMPLFEDEDLDVEIEYQLETIGRFGLDFNGKHFLLTNLQTDCLAQDNCGNPLQKVKVNLSNLMTPKPSACAPGSGCC